jgi:hypothetical protein
LSIDRDQNRPVTVIAMHDQPHHDRVSGWWRSLSLVALVITAVLTISAGLAAQDSEPLAVPAEFIRELKIPGSLDQMLRPSKVLFDPTVGELYVADQGNNRIVIFDRNGTYRFEFPIEGRLGSIVDFAVAPSGYIYVLGSTRDGYKLLKFDFDGLYLGEVAGPAGSLAGMSVTTLAVDSLDRIYLLDQAIPQLVRLSPDGVVEIEAPFLTELSAEERLELVLGRLTACADGLLLPASSIGSVYRFDWDCRRVAKYGHHGALTGSLNFPVSAVVSDNGMVLVLDKRRFNVLCFTAKGAFVGEFGGKGNSLGWFYLPSSLAVDGDLVTVSQVYLNRVQICRIPGSILRRFERTSAKDNPASSDSISNEHTKTIQGVEIGNHDAENSQLTIHHIAPALPNNLKGGLQCEEYF